MAEGQEDFARVLLKLLAQRVKWADEHPDSDRALSDVLLVARDYTRAMGYR